MEHDARYSLLENVQQAEIVLDPFPHLIVRKPIPDEIADQLIAEFPPDDVVISGSPGSPMGSNKRFNIYARDVAAHSGIAPIWKAFIREQSSARFVQHLFRLFGPFVREYYPELARQLGDGFERVRAGVRSQDGFDTCNVLLDAGISINSPVTSIPTSVREAHLDLPTKLFTGLYYLRPPEDQETQGGDLELCRYRPGRSRRFSKFDADPNCVEAAKVVPYEKNVLVAFVNSMNSVHAVTPRLRTRHTRKFVNLVVEVEKPLFNGESYQVGRLPFRARYYVRQLLSWRRASSPSAATSSHRG